MSGNPLFHSGGEITEEDGRWIHGFVVDTIVRWQLGGFSPCVPQRLAPGCDDFCEKEKTKAEPAAQQGDEAARP